MRRSLRALGSLLLLGLILAGGCTKQTSLVVGEADIRDGRMMEITFSDGSVLTGRLVRGSTVRYTRHDSLFAAEIHDLEDDFIELSRQQLLTDLTEWTELRRVAEQSETIEDRPEFGGTILMMDEINSIALVQTDRRRLVTESMFWVAAAMAAGLAAFTP